ncbi:cholecystokinin receptor type A-like [Mytilus trossulus]|uniref:cholecystokinin receptor type A-like n=1 Tax=Mytilus trossulus TaxID=6551 RepID=UPI00300426F0
MDTNISSATNVTDPFEDRPLLAVMGMLAFFSVLGTAGNAMVLYVYVRKRHKLAATVFIISLAATDFMTCLVIVPYTIAVEYLDYFITYDIICKLYMFFITSNVPFAAFIMVGIAVDRYLCICHPFCHLMNAQRAKNITLSLAGVAFLLGVVTSLNYSVYKKCLYSKVEYSGKCQPSETIFSSSFVNTYQNLYAALFLLAFIAVFILYGLVYRSVLIRRAKRRRQRRSTQTVSVRKESWFSEHHRPSLTNIFSKKCSDAHERHPDVEIARQLTIREKGLVANIRTAAMLFVVTAVFIVAFLPAWLMAHTVIQYHMVVFYTYFSYNVANPIIYAFMNKAFRRDLREVFDCKSVLRELN